MLLHDLYWRLFLVLVGFGHYGQGGNSSDTQTNIGVLALLALQFMGEKKRATLHYTNL